MNGEGSEIVFTTAASIEPVVGAKGIEILVSDVPVVFKKGVEFYS